MANVDFRIDSEFHRKPLPKNPKHNYIDIGNILTFAQYGVSIEMNEESVGYPIYRMNEISNMLCNTDVLKCANLTPIEASQYVLEENDVLFNRTNSQDLVGRTGIFKKFSENPFIFASYLIRFRTDETKVLPEYLTAFLNCKYGVWDIKRRARISINQSNVNAEEVKAILLPVLDINFQTRLRDLFNKAHSLREESKALYSKAENLLLRKLGLHSFVPSTENTTSIKFSEVFGFSGRLDAEFYRPKYKQYHEILLRHARGATLGDLATLTKGCQARNLSEKGVLYASIKDISGFEIETTERTGESNLVMIEPNDVVLAITGATIGKTGINATNEKIAVSGDLVGIKPFSLSPYYLQVVLASKPIQEICRQYTTGATNGHLAISDVANFPFPLLTSDMQDKISHNVISAIQRNRQSKLLLETAKRAVEMAIEENEQAALKLLQTKLGDFSGV